MKEKIWLWCHPTGAHDGRWNLPAATATPGEALRCLGIENAVYVVFNNLPQPPFAPHVGDLKEARRLVWSIVGDSSSHRNDAGSDLEPVLDLARDCPNLTGAITDDFFFSQPGPGGEQARLSLDEFAGCRDALGSREPPLELWTVVYDMILGRPLKPYLDLCDVVTYWTWEARNLVDLEKNFPAVEAMAPACRKLLGCYMWDYGSGGAEVPPELMKKQCRLAESWIESGRIDGIVFLAGNLCGTGTAGFEYVRDWLADR